jgi:hypothetical protein
LRGTRCGKPWRGRRINYCCWAAVWMGVDGATDLLSAVRGCVSRSLAQTLGSWRLKADGGRRRALYRPLQQR